MKPLSHLPWVVLIAACAAPPRPPDPPRPASALVQSTPATPDIDTGPVFQTLPPPTLDGGEPYHFKEIRVPPRANEEALSFPPASEKTPPVTARPPPVALKVTRTQPEGDQEVVGSVNATFNQPMVPLASLEDLKAHPVPIEIEPLPPGRFRWLGTSTVEFEPVDRMPFATKYTVRVPASATSEAGKALGQDVIWSFETPRPVVTFSPNNGFNQAVPDQLLQLAFNQDVAASAVLDALACTAGGKRIQLVASHPDEDPFKADTSADVTARRKIFEQRNVFVRPSSPLPLDAEVTCTLPVGFRGAEGPLPTTVPQSVTFRTYPPLRLVGIRCGWERCAPSDGIRAEFNTTLEQDQDFPSLVHVDPGVANLTVEGAGPFVLIGGDLQPSTTYHVRIASRLRDIHGQHIAEDAVGDVSLEEDEPQLQLTGAPMGILEAVGPRVIPVHSTNLHQAQLRWFKLDAKELPGVLQLVSRSQYAWNEGDPFASLQPSAARTIELSGHDDRDTAKGIVVDEFLGKGKPGLAVVDLDAPELKRAGSYANTHRAMVVQITDLGITAHLTEDKAIVLVTSLSTGRPVPGATVRVLAENEHNLPEGETDDRGIVELPGAVAYGKHPGNVALAASKGEDQAVLIFDAFRAGENVTSYMYGQINPHSPSVVASVFTDRQPYRPGETVHVAGIVRIATHGVTGGIEPLPDGARVKYAVVDSHGGKSNEGTVEIGALGVFSADVKIPPDAFLGQHTFEGVLEHAGRVRGQHVSTTFDVEEYRTPEFKVSIDTGEPPHFVNDLLHATVHGEYFFGGAMSGAEATWNITRSEGTFTPPGATGFTFGETSERRIWPLFGRPTRASEPVAHGSGALGSDGALPISAKLDRGKLKGPVSFTVEASVTDANRQVISTSQTVLAHAGASYPGIKIDRAVVKEGETVQVSAVTFDVDGQRHDPPVAVEVAERTWKRGKRTAREPEEPTETPITGCDLSWNHRLEDAATCKVKLPKAGDYVVRVRVKDPQGRENVSSTTVWATGKGWTPWLRHDEVASVELVADKPEHAPGETARVLVRSPFPRSVGILAVQREGLIEYRALDFEGSAHLEEIRLTEAEVPNVVVTVSVVHGRVPAEESDDGDDPGRPMYAGGQLTLPISTTAHAINVAVATEKPAIEPGGKLNLTVRTTGRDGQALSARLAIAVVDEGVLSLLGYSLPNPLARIFQTRPGEGGDVSEVPLVMPREGKLTPAMEEAPPSRRPRRKAMKAGFGRAAEGMMFDEAAMPMAATALLRAAAEPPRMTARTFFASTAWFSADQRTNDRGELALTIPMPENLTRYRIMVVAVGVGERFGEGDGSVQVRKPLLVRPALPRFLNLGDKFRAAAVINNQTDGDLWVDAQARVGNGAVDAQRQRVFVKAGQATEVSFDAVAGTPGASRWQIAAVALAPERWNDAAELDVPVELPTTVEAFATYGTTTSSVRQPLELPKDALPDFGGLEVSMSSTALAGLSDAVVYLHDYPYECVEQTASRILPLIVLRDVIEGFHLKGAGTAEERDKLIRDGLKRIWAKQRPDGGFGYWSDSRESYLYVSAWAAYVIARAQAAGYPSETYKLQQLKSFLESRTRHPRADLGEDVDFSSQAMAVLSLSMLGSQSPDLVKQIYEHRSSLAIFGKAWLMEAAHREPGNDNAEEQELDREIQSAAVESASSAHFAESKSESIRLLMHSNQRTDAIVLAALLHVRPKDPLIPKIMHGLNESRHHGRWDTTQSNAWSTIAMADYYEAFEHTVPDFVTSLFVGDGFVGEGRFSGRETKILTENVPLAAAQRANSDLLIEKEGEGRLYYRLGLRYAPRDLKLGAEEQGFTVKRTYLPMPEAPDSVMTDADGTVHVRPGAEVRVKIEIVVPDRASFVAVDDPLPAGLEAVNTSFLTSRAQAERNAEQEETHRRWWWRWTPFNHTELRDDRVVLFADELPAGVYTHTYVARATTNGTFQAPPARAFQMYEPESFGRTASTVVDVQ